MHSARFAFTVITMIIALALFGCGKDGGGYMRSYNGNGDESAYVGTGRMGGGRAHKLSNIQ